MELTYIHFCILLYLLMMSMELEEVKEKKQLNKLISFMLTALLVIPVAGCSAGRNSSAFNSSEDISVISREAGSGTRGAFVELFGVEQKNPAGQIVDETTEEASIASSTAVVMTSVQGDKYSIGYMSLGSLDSSVKALKIDGAAPTADNIGNGTYKIARPFNLVTKNELSVVAKDFVSFILSTEGQQVVEKNGYIQVPNVQPYDGSKPSGKIVVAGSSSVSPVMEKLKEAYIAVNPNADIEVQESDSTTGINSVSEGVCDIGMASRDLKDSESAKGLSTTVIAIDGIAVVVNNNNPVGGMTSEQVMNIFTGNIHSWSEVME